MELFIELQTNHFELQKRYDNLVERRKNEGNTFDVYAEMMELQKDINDLERRTNGELVRLGLK